MAILIPDIKMPKSCMECPLEYDFIRCRLLGRSLIWVDDTEGNTLLDIGIDTEEQRLPECPLVEAPDKGYIFGVDLATEEDKTISRHWTVEEIEKIQMDDLKNLGKRQHKSLREVLEEKDGKTETPHDYWTKEDVDNFMDRFLKEYPIQFNTRKEE